MRSSTRILSLPKQDWIVVGWVLAIKLLSFYFGAKSCALLWDKCHRQFQAEVTSGEAL
jgi:hypothetical protein